MKHSVLEGKATQIIEGAAFNDSMENITWLQQFLETELHSYATVTVLAFDKDIIMRIDRRAHSKYV